MATPTFYDKIQAGLAKEPPALDPFQLRLARAIFGASVYDLALSVCKRIPGLTPNAVRTFLAQCENYGRVTVNLDRQCARPALVQAIADSMKIPPASLCGDPEQLRLSRQRFRAWVAADRPPILQWVREQDDPTNPDHARWHPSKFLTREQMGATITACLHAAAWHHRVAAALASDQPDVAMQHREMGRVIQALALARTDAAWPAGR